MNGSQPLVSIISLTYNHERFISECIESVLAQSYTNWEMLIIDDGSTDRTGEIAKEYALKDPRINYYHQENVGVFLMHTTYNKGLSLSRGKYIAILECDDTWFSEKLQTQIKTLEEKPALVLAWSQAYNSRLDITSILKTQPDSEQSQYREDFENNPPGRIARSIMFGNYLPALTLVIRKDILIEIGGFQHVNKLPLVDHPTLLRLSHKGLFHFEEKPLGTYRRYTGQTTKKFSLDIIEGYKQCYYDYYESLTEQQKLFLNISPEKAQTKMYTMEMSGRSVYARACLMRREFKEARKQYIKVILFPHTANILWRLRSLVGFVLSLFNTNVETLARLMGKRYYQ